MIRSKAAFVVYGVHKDGLKDPDGNPFIDQQKIDASKAALRELGVELAEEKLVVATKAEAREVICGLAKDDSIDCLILFSGTWVWAAHLVGAIREFAKTGKGIVIWTHAGSQGWRPVGGLVLHGGLNEIGVSHKFVYGSADNARDVKAVYNYCMASAVKNRINLTTLMAFGGRGMGQTCGVADPSQWMKTFGIDIDSRDTYELLETAKAIDEKEVNDLFDQIDKRFNQPAVRDDQSARSLRLYLALKKLMKKEGFSYYTIQSFPGMGDYYTATCFAQSMMLDDQVPTSTLSDYNTCMSSILLTYLGTERVYYGDLQHIDKSNNEIKIIGDGAVPPTLADSQGCEFAGHGIPTEGSAGGISVNLTCKKGVGVLARLSRVNGKFIMPIARCTINAPDPATLTQRRHECGIPFWPHAFVTVQGDIEKLLENWNNEYACLGYGEDLADQLVDFCKLTGIEPILI